MRRHHPHSLLLGLVREERPYAGDADQAHVAAAALDGRKVDAFV
jgi:hypothetical protein